MKVQRNTSKCEYAGAKQASRQVPLTIACPGREGDPYQSQSCNKLHLRPSMTLLLIMHKIHWICHKVHPFQIMPHGKKCIEVNQHTMMNIKLKFYC